MEFNFEFEFKSPKYKSLKPGLKFMFLKEEFFHYGYKINSNTEVEGNNRYTIIRIYDYISCVQLEFKKFNSNDYNCRKEITIYLENMITEIKRGYNEYV